MSTEKQHDESSQALDFLSPRLREILRRLAKRDRRDDVQELVWIIEGYAKGQLQDHGDSPASPRIPLEGLPEVHYPQKILVTRVPGQVGEKAPQPDRE